ncbi:hypothetical protein DNI29_22170 [Hymenobacter sediminis]|uniref:hypothetical protein n=1 Tax=Hymenobacter sediminis TaxID=2218621 RepID=UPI000DA6CC1D|nr:hypothetical protein [Hymenobacter sediminis]RPD44106.1 hypothetical protein DNI29_22170 [Hymenobacter sediminis]
MNLRLFLCIPTLLVASCRFGEDGAEAAKLYCQCLEHQGPYYNDARANQIAVERICQGKLMEKYASYRQFIVLMEADSPLVVSPEIRESSRLFMRDFLKAERAYRATTTVK